MEPRLVIVQNMAQASMVARKAIGPIMLLFVGLTSVMFYSRLGKSPVLTKEKYLVLKENTGEW